jgi:phosphoenolpyruvate---glycerone phosphotransferase subunit DhaL
MRVLALSAMLDNDVLADALARVAARVDAMRDVLNAADRSLGDGDTGMTLAGIVGAWRAASVRDAPDVGAAIVALGRAAAAATGSSLGSVIAIGLRAAGRDSAGRATLDRAGLVAALDAALRAISERSGAKPGDKTVLDSLVAIHRALAGAVADRGLGPVALAAAESALREYRDRASKLGRARMYGERSIGQDDPGMLAVVLLLRAATAAPDESSGASG